MPRLASLFSSPYVWQTLLGVYWLAMFVGTHIPRQLPHLSGGVFDKFVHLGAYAGLALLVAVNWQLRGGHLTMRHYLAVAFVLATYGIVDEVLQMFVHRDCSVADWAADVVGIVLGIAAFHVGRKVWLGNSSA
jgi:VanZ family protein